MSDGSFIAVNSEAISYQDGLFLGRAKTNINQISLQKMAPCSLPIPGNSLYIPKAESGD